MHTYQIQDGNLHHTLIEVGSLIFDDFNGYNLLCFQVLALDNLSKSSLAKDVKDEITIPGRAR